LETSLLQEFLPELLLEHFSIVSFYKLGNLETKKMEFEIHLDEKNELPSGCIKEDYESKGFLPGTKIQDFPIRGQAVYLVIRRRRWRHKLTKKEVSNDYSLIAEGSRLTKDISDFLKGTGRDPRRYNK
jgi:hypothetical protein